jgi:hypothetical protein
VVERWATSWMIGGSNPGSQGVFLFTTASRPALGPTSYPVGTRGSFSGSKAAGA